MSEKSNTGDVPIRYCYQCGREEHGTAGCYTSPPIYVIEVFLDGLLDIKSIPQKNEHDTN